MGRRQAKQHREARRRLRRRLEAACVPQYLIDSTVEQLRKRQDAARRAGVQLDQLDALHDRTWARLSPDDRGYQPDHGDPLLRGAARAVGATAKVVKRRKTITKYQHDRQEPT